MITLPFVFPLCFCEMIKKQQGANFILCEPFLFIDKEVLKPDRKSMNKDYAKKSGQGGFMAQRIPAFLRSKKLKKRTRPGTSLLQPFWEFVVVHTETNGTLLIFE